MEEIAIAAHMLVRNEVDVIAEILTEITQWDIDQLVILDGQSDDGTIEVIQDFARRFTRVPIFLHVSPDPGGRFADHRRQELLDFTRVHKPDWIISVDGDEIYHTDPVAAVRAAEAAGANVVWSDIPQFWLTLDDIRGGLLLEDPTQSIQERRRWYSWGHTGCFTWRDHEAHYYPLDVQKRTPEYQGVPDYREWQRPGPERVVCKHYCFRSLPQALKRAAERLERGGRKYFGKYAYDFLIDERAASLHYFRGEWRREYNHDKVHAYMGRLSE